MNFFRCTLTVAFCAFLKLVSSAYGNDLPPSQTISFSAQVAPVLQSRCVACHGEKLAESDYRMDTFAALVAKTSDDQPAVLENEPESSELYQRLIHQDEDLRMPAESAPLPAQEIELIRSWIEQGADFDGDSRDRLLTDLLPMLDHPAAPTKYRASIPISALAVIGDENRIYAGGYHEITVWNTAGELVSRIGNQGQRTYSIAPHPAGISLLAASGTPGIMGEVRIFDVVSGKLQAVVTRTNEAILDAQYSPDGKQIAVALPNGSIEIYNTNTLNKVVTLLGHSDQVTSVRWHTDSNRLGTTSRDNAAKIYDVKTGRSITTFAGHTACVNCLAFLDGNDVITVSDDGKATIWSSVDGRKNRDVISGPLPLLDVARFDRHYWITSTTDAQQYEIGSHRRIAQLQSQGVWVTTVARNRVPDLRVFGLHSGELIVRQGDQEMPRILARP
ncbi:MAG: hypothetical protein P8L85_06675 [Rubripirellula sp.]|nr:hypothetical protein [Rubripirellula sp.]